MSKIRFGLALQNYVAVGEYIDPKELVAHAEKAEDLGYRSTWVWDHIILGGKNVFPVHDSITILTAVAARTKNLRLATGVLIVSLRNPVVLAKQIATLDNLSNGRVTLGVAAGWYQREFQAVGVPFDTRGRTLKVNVEIMKRLWTENNVTGVYGEHNLRSITMEPKPIQKPHPPLWMGGYIDRVLKRVGELADGWISYFYTPESFSKSWQKVVKSAEQTGKVPAKMGNCDMVPTRLDMNEENGQRVANAFISKYCDLPAWSEATPKSMIAGTSRDCANRIEEYAKAGVQELVLIPAVTNLTEIPDQIERFGREIIPSFS